MNKKNSRNCISAYLHICTSTHLIVFLFLSTIAQNSSAQEDLMKILEQDSTPKNEIVTATFKSTRLISLHTLETEGKRTLDFRISHRFNDINSGAYNFWGIDGGANIRLALEYSYDGRLMFGIGRSSYEKMLDGFIKYRLLRQTTNSMPISITLLGTSNFTTMKDPNKDIANIDKYGYVTDRFSYVGELIIGRKFSNRFSLQISPTFIHYNIVDKITDKNDMYAIGAATRFKITQRFAVTGEYVYRLNKYSKNFSNYYDEAGIGVDIETGGHVFQIHVTNAVGINEGQFIPYTTTSWKNAGIRLGFNISRVFTL